MAAPLPRVASLNVCADQLLILLADSEQILSLSYLAHDPAASHFHAAALSWPINRGQAEEVLALEPDLVLLGPFGSRYTRQLLAQSSIRTQEVPLIESLDALKLAISSLAEAIQQTERAANIIALLDARVDAVNTRRRREDLSPRPLAAVYESGGHTVGEATLRGEALALAGFDNAATLSNIERYGQLSLESMIVQRPEILLTSPYSDGTWSRAQALARHPALLQRGINPREVRVPSRDTICAGPWLVDVIEQLLEVRDELVRARVQP